MSDKNRYVGTVINAVLAVGTCIAVQLLARRLGLSDSAGGIAGVVAAFGALRLFAARLRSCYMQWYLARVAARASPSDQAGAPTASTPRRRSRPVLWLTFLLSGVGLALADRASPLFWLIITAGGVSFAVNALLLLVDS
jgi:hypothetical protein